MKKRIVIISALLLIILKINAQDTLSRVANITLPKGAKSLSKRDVETFSSKQFSKKPTHLANDKSYQIENLLITLRDLGKEPNSKRTVEDIKKDVEGGFRQTGTAFVDSKIITVNSMRFFVFQYFNGDDGSLNFYSDYMNNKNVAGQIYFNRKDEVRAKQYLQKILQHITFKR